MADAAFKSRDITFPMNWTARSKGGMIGNDRYRPDRSFKNEIDDVVCIIESSSTSDRKVGVGELCLADKFFTDHKIEGILIFSLCGNSAYPPRPDTQSIYLEPYFRHLRSGDRAYGVREVYFISENQFSELGWVALDTKFKEKAYGLKA